MRLLSLQLWTKKVLKDLSRVINDVWNFITEVEVELDQIVNCRLSGFRISIFEFRFCLLTPDF